MTGRNSVISSGRLWRRSSKANAMRRLLACGLWAVLGLGLPARVGWPAGGPSVEGRVTILDREGKSKNHHDGVVVFLDELERQPALTPPSSPAIIRQVNKQFVPDVVPILMGTTVEFPNTDTVYHNVFSLSRIKPFDLGIYEQGGSKSVTFDQPGLVKVYCNIHPGMIASILVMANPHFTTTDREGRFAIRDAPLGSAKLRMWSPRSREHPDRPIVVTAQGVKDLELGLVEDLRLEIREETISLKHKNKWGEDYPAKY